MPNEIFKRETGYVLYNPKRSTYFKVGSENVYGLIFADVFATRNEAQEILDCTNDVQDFEIKMVTINIYL